MYHIGAYLYGPGFLYSWNTRRNIFNSFLFDLEILPKPPDLYSYHRHNDHLLSLHSYMGTNGVDEEGYKLDNYILQSLNLDILLAFIIIFTTISSMFRNYSVMLSLISISIFRSIIEDGLI